MLNKLKNLIKQDKQEEALKLFIKIKEIYHEPVSKEVFDDKEKLKKEISELYNNFTKDSRDSVKEKAVLPAANLNKEIQDNKKGLKDISPKEKEGK